MIHFLVGPAGGFTHWCEDVIAGAMRRHCAAVDVVHASTARELGEGLLRSRGRSALIVLDQASGALYSAMRESGRKLVVVEADPLSALFEHMQKDGAGLAGAVRAVASGYATLPSFMSLPNALMLKPPADAAKVAAILDHLGLGPAPAALAPPSGQAGDLFGWWNSLGTAAQTMIAGAFNPASQSPASFDWAPGLFWTEDSPSKPATGPIDITGRARCLLAGPAILLPLGRWRLSLGLAFSEMAAGHVFQLELSAGTILAVENLCPLTAGEMEVHFVFAIGDNGQVSVRLLLQRAAFDGTVQLAGARVMALGEGTVANALDLGSSAAVRLVQAR